MKQHDSRFLSIVKDAQTRIREIAWEQVQEKLDQGETIFLVDVREDHEWEKGHIPNAIHIGKGVLERDIEKLTTDVNAEMVLYCGGGYRSALGADALQKMGYQKVWSLIGGYGGWCQHT